MNKRLHIIITTENGGTVRLPFDRKRLITYSISASIFLLCLIVISFFTISIFTKNLAIKEQLATLQHQVDNGEQILASQKRQSDQEKLELSLEVAALKLDNATQAASFKEEKEMLMSNAVSELNERSELIETIMSNIGIKIQQDKQKQKQNSGGPFIGKDPSQHDDLLYKTDAYLKYIQSIPLGKPSSGSITSRFGSRRDPVNNKKSFHEGVDFGGKRGDKIHATGDGVIVTASRKGSYGNYVLIDHQNGYKTAYAHMQNYTVNKGDRVKRGQLIGQVGNTGRSTGPHLHYEIIYKNKPVNPKKYLRVGELAKPVNDKTKKK